MARKVKQATFKVGDRVRTSRPLQAGLVPAGSVGVVVEVRTNGSRYSDGVSAEFMVKPHPHIARIFGDDPNVAKPTRLLFPHTSVSQQIELA